MASSNLYPGEQIFDDDNPLENLEIPDGLRGGLLPRQVAYGAIVGVPPFPDELLIPRSEWQSRIQEMEERKSRISDIIVAAKLPVKDQGQTNFCWANAPCTCLEILRIIANLPMKVLSPASVACPINGFRNQGGWGKDAIEWLTTHGAVPVDMWGANVIDRSKYTEAAKQAALENRVLEWWDVRPRNLDQLVSCLLRRLPCACGYNRIAHEMTSCDAVWLDGEVAIRDRNSHGDRSDQPNGFLILRGSNALPDDIQAPRAAA